MEFTLPLPHQLDKNGILSKQWTSFNQRYRYHRNTTLVGSSYMDTTSVLLFAAHHEISSLFESLKVYDLDLPKLNKILDIIEQVCLPHFILLFERFRYFTLEQDASETLNEFVHGLRKQVELCEFGDVKDSIMTSALVNGVNDANFKQSLQNTERLCFDDAVTMCNEGLGKGQSSGDASSKRQASLKRKAKTTPKPNVDADMYMVPLYDNINEEMDEDDHVVKTIMNVTKKRTKVKRKKKMNLLKMPLSDRPKIFLCFTCDNEYATRKSFRRHIAAKHGDCKEFFCKHCEMTFGTRTECITHCRGHNSTPATPGQAPSVKDGSNTEYQCWYCDEIIPNLPDYKKHCATHTAVRVFYCDLCGRKNHTLLRMMGHIKGHLAPRLKCEICANCFGRPELLAAHMLTHAAQPVHQCQVCSKNFCSADRLQGHMRTHSGEKRFTCELCGKSFCQKMSLDYHKRVHAGEKPYACDICGKRTASFGYLRKHKQMHSDKRPYVCEVCGKSFRFISNLNRHRNGHTGKRAFACDVCGRTFIYGEGLRDHIKAGRCPGRKNDGESKRQSKAPRVRHPPVPHVPNPPHPNDQGPAYYPAPQHPPPEALLSELQPWQYMLSRNNDPDGSGNLVVVPPYY